MAHKCKAILVVCMDFRFQKAIGEFAEDQSLQGKYDLFSIAGTQKSFLDALTRKIALKQIELSKNLHGTSDVYLIAHWDCGAYGGSKAFESAEAERNRYIGDLQKAKEIINENFASLTVHKYLANLDVKGNISFERIE